MARQTEATTSELPKISLEGYKLLAENLQKGDVVEYKYQTEDGDIREHVGVIAKANRGGIRIVKPDSSARRPLAVINCSGGTVFMKKGNGATDHKKEVGTRGRVLRTGETAEVSTVRAGRKYVTDYEPDN